MSSLNSITSDEAKRHSVKSMGSDSSSSGQSSLLTVDIKNFKALWNEEVYQNRERWKAQASKGTVHLTHREYETVKWSSLETLGTLLPCKTELSARVVISTRKGKLTFKAAMLLAHWRGDFTWPVLMWDFLGYTGISMSKGFILIFIYLRLYYVLISHLLQRVLLVVIPHEFMLYKSLPRHKWEQRWGCQVVWIYLCLVFILLLHAASLICLDRWTYKASKIRELICHLQLESTAYFNIYKWITGSCYCRPGGL